MYYNCDMCGCYLDPGEGRLCDECQEKERRRHKITEQQKNVFRESRNDGQMEMMMEELIS